MYQTDGRQGTKAAEQFAEENAERESCQGEKHIREVGQAE